MRDETIVALFAIGCLTLIEIACLLTDINHATLALVISTIAGLAGYKMGRRRK
jgi:hypothetical protein